MRNQKRWTEEEDKIMMEYMKNTFASIDQGLGFVADQLGRTKSSCFNRYHVLRSNKTKPKKLSLTPKQVAKGMSDILEDYERLKLENKSLLDEVKLLKKEVSSLASMKQDYEDLLKIMDRARNLAFVVEEKDKTRFKMDTNGNLERMDK